MGRVINLARYRAGRRPECGPPDDPLKGHVHSISIVRNEDGSRSVAFTGDYSDDAAYAIEALTELAAALAGRIRRFRSTP
jgi:hypothetical protein